jgi:hypothetical protein
MKLGHEALLLILSPLKPFVGKKDEVKKDLELKKEDEARELSPFSFSSTPEIPTNNLKRVVSIEADNRGNSKTTIFEYQIDEQEKEVIDVQPLAQYNAVGGLLCQ